LRRRFQSLDAIDSVNKSKFYVILAIILSSSLDDKKRLPLIPPDKEAELYGYIIGKADYLGCIIHAIDGTENHTHLVVSIPPNLSIGKGVKKSKVVVLTIGIIIYLLTNYIGKKDMVFFL
jgi:hypothetical protein